MAESQSHMNLVKRLRCFAEQLLGEGRFPLAYFDEPTACVKPPKTSGGFVPDMFFKDNELMVIGEAKTFDDVDRNHSLSQYENYFKDLAVFPGRTVMVFSVPWQCKNTIKNIGRRLRKESDPNIEIYAITEVGQAEKV